MACMIDVSLNIKKLAILEGIPGVPFGYEFWKGKPQKKFGIVKCVARNPLEACGADCGYFRRQKGNPHHVCDANIRARSLIYKDLHRFEIVREHIPTRLFFRLGWRKSNDESDLQADQRVDRFITRVRAYVRNHEALEYVVILTREVDYERSYLVVFPNAVLPSTNSDMTDSIEYMCSCTNSTNADTGNIVDLTVYGRNHMMLMFGQSEYGKSTFKPMKWRDPVLNPGDDRSSQCDTLVQGLKDLVVNRTFTADLRNVRISLVEEEKRLVLEKKLADQLAREERKRKREEDEAAGIRRPVSGSNNSMFKKKCCAIHGRAHEACILCVLSRNIVSRLFSEIAQQAKTTARKEKATLTRRAKAAKVKKVKALIKRREVKKAARKDRKARKEAKTLANHGSQLVGYEDYDNMPINQPSTSANLDLYTNEPRSML